MKRLHISTRVYRGSLKDTRRLIKECQGIVLVYLLIFHFLKNCIIFPFLNKIWGFCIANAKSPYILNSNFSMIFQSPELILVGLLILFVYCIVSIWELSGIILCVEYIDQKKSPKLLHLIFYSLCRIRHMALPKNWLFFVYLALMIPMTGFYNASGLFSGFVIPEYISQFIESHWYLLLALIAIILLFLLFVLRWFYSIESVILKRNDFIEARKESLLLTKGRMLKETTDLAVFTIIEAIRIAIIPGIISLFFIMASLYFTRDWNTAELSSNLIYISHFGKRFKDLVKFFLSISIASYFVVTYKYLLNENHQDQEIILNEKIVKHRGRIFKFYFLKRLCFGGLLFGYIILYGLTNLMFINYPEFANDFIDQKIIIAHKGYSSTAPENTMDSFQKAYENGKAGMIELDVRSCKDGIPVVIHDESVKGAIGLDKSIYDMTYEEVRSNVASYSFDKSEFKDAYIPTLEEVLKLYGKKIPLLIEIKMDDRTPDLPGQIIELIKKYDCLDTCQIHSGSYEALEMVKAIEPDIPCGLIIAFGAGAYYSLPCADFFSVEHTFVDETMLDQIHSVDKKVYAWTVNEDSSINDMKYLDVDGLITDYQQDIYNVLHKKDDIIHVFLNDVKSDMTIQEENGDFINEEY